MSTFISHLSDLRRATRVLLLAALASLPLVGRADTVASLLGDFTINQYCGLALADNAVDVHFVVVFGQLPALRELHQADSNGDGVTTQQERDDYVSHLAADFGQHLDVTVDGTRVPLRTVHWTTSLPKEQTGFSMRVDIDFAGALPASTGVRTLRFENSNYAGRIGWHEIAVAPAAGLKVFDTDAFGNSMTGGLTQALQSLPASGPLDERAVHLRFTPGVAPAGAVLLADRGARPALAAGPASSLPAGAGWLQTQTQRLIALISAPQVPLHIAALALLAAMFLGALHALSPGHGKSIVGAYLVGSRGTPRHAAFLGLTVTVTHTLVVFALGLATLLASQFVVPEKLFPVLSLLSGVLVLGMGLVLFVKRLRAARGAWRVPTRAARSSLTLQPAFAGSHGLGHAQADEHLHAHRHTHDHAPVHAHGHDHGPIHAHSHRLGAHAHGADQVSGASSGVEMHAHGGSMHTHLPPGAHGEAISWRGLLALGVSGGLLPCPSAMVLLLAAVALNKTFFGLLLVVAFSVGLAVTLTGVGMAFLYARNRFGSRLGVGRWPHLLPVLSAASITALGAFLCYGTLVAAPL